VSRATEERSGVSSLAMFDDSLRDAGFPVVAGVDEAGRGPLAGPVVAAAVVLPRAKHPVGIDDSKRLSARKREAVFSEILRFAVEVSVGVAWQDEIDEVNIRVASLRAMARAVDKLCAVPNLVLVDGKDLPDLLLPAVALVHADARSESVAAASIVAKVVRDALMCEFHTAYPEYGFDRHKGYPTPEHLRRLAVLGPCPLHRRSFHGVG
jgi:ribonuclease HII